jgi:hypothetical protein
MFKPYSRAFAFAALSAVAAFGGPNDSAWIDLFNPKDTSLATNWDIKITGSALNVDPRNTFRRSIIGSDTVLEVNYSNYTGTFNYGHIGYKHRAFSYYIVRAEHQFVGTTQTAGHPGSWALQNNGIMHHSQSAASMTTNQDFPISLEAQLLGPNNTGADNNSSMNLCTPGTAFYTTASGGSVNTNHCVSAATKNRAQALAPNWAWAHVEAYSDSIIKYYFKDSLVYTFYRPVYYAGNVSNPPANTPADNTRLTGGYILLQSESHATRFRRVQLLNLEGCMTPTDANYKTYFVKHDSTACGQPAGVLGGREDIRAGAPMNFVGNSIKVGGTSRVTLRVYDMRGNVIARHTAQAPFQWTPAVKQSGMHVIQAITPQGTYTERAPLF